MAVIINFVTTEPGFVCVHGQLRKDENTLVGDYTYNFIKVEVGRHIDTPRQFLDFFDNYQDLYNAFHELTEVPEEDMI